MAGFVLYTDRQVFAAGLKNTLANMHQLDILPLENLLAASSGSLWDQSLQGLILDASPEASHLIQGLRSAHPGLPLVVWQRVVASEPALNAIGAGVQGVLLDSSSPEDVFTCLETVLAGGIWVPASVSQAMISSRICKLTRREGQLVNLVTQGLRNKEIAYSLGLCEGTVKVYLSHLFDKLGVSDRYELVILALRHGNSVNAAPASEKKVEARQSMYIPRNNTRWSQSTAVV